jgi:hypothetical protein
MATVLMDAKVRFDELEAGSVQPVSSKNGARGRQKPEATSLRDSREEGSRSQGNSTEPGSAGALAIVAVLIS